MKKTILITGVNGFVGAHCAKEFAVHDWQVIGTGQESAPNTEASEYLSDYWQVNLLDAAALQNHDYSQITCVLNLAGIATNQFTDAEKVTYINCGVHTTLYDYLQKLSIHPRILAVSTAAVYAAGTMPQTEISATKTIQEARPYEASKLQLESALESYKNVLPIVVVRPFNHIGPGQAAGFLVPDIATEIVTARQNNAAIKTGNLDTKRDYTDVRDVARAYRLLAEAPHLQYDLYNICSGVSVAGETIVSLLKEHLQATYVQSLLDPSKVRPNEIPEVYGSYERLKAETSWKPQIPIGQTIKDFCEWFTKGD